MSKTDTELTKKKLLEAARKEFLAVGYEKASLRKICADADMTTGALYFIFKDKKALFESIINEPVMKLQEVLYAHYAEEAAEAVDEADDMQASVDFTRMMYAYREEFMLLVNNPVFLNPITDEIIRRSEVHYTNLYEKMSQGKKADPYMIHWVCHVQTEAFVNLLAHVENVDDALKEIPKLVAYLRAGFFSQL